MIILVAVFYNFFPAFLYPKYGNWNCTCYSRCGSTIGLYRDIVIFRWFLITLNTEVPFSMSILVNVFILLCTVTSNFLSWSVADSSDPNTVDVKWKDKNQLFECALLYTCLALLFDWQFTQFKNIVPELFIISFSFYYSEYFSIIHYLTTWLFLN